MGQHGDRRRTEFHPYRIFPLSQIDRLIGVACPRSVGKIHCIDHMPDPELLIRTGGEIRLSNFLLWQAAYTELYFCDTFWPDFNMEELCKAIYVYQQRERRYGKTGAQVAEQNKNE